MSESTATPLMPTDDQFEQLCLRYCVGDIDEADFAQLQKSLASRSDRMDLFVQIAMQVETLRELYSAAAEEDASLETSDDDEVVLNEVIQAALISRQRREAEELANARLREQQARDAGEQRINPQVPDIGPRVIVIPTPVAWVGLAAAVVLAVLIGFALWPDNTPTQPIAQQPAPPTSPNTPSSDQPVVPVVPVATLTAAHADQWQAASGLVQPAVGDSLTPGQRLTLTSGYAQLTTSHGAVAILEAPCTIELTDSPNAIRLLSGKLAGLVHTDQAKGFVVITPHMKIVDVGTQFGVACTEDRTSVRVIEGEVLAAAADDVDDTQQLQLLTGQAAVSTIDAPRATLSNEPADRFVMSWLSVSEIPTLTGDIRYEPSLPRDLRVGGYENNEIMLFCERAGVSLEQPITVNITEPGTYTGQAHQQTVTMAPAKVDSYLIHLDTLPDAGSVSKKATIRFNQPILGLVTSANALSQSHRTLGQPNVLYGTMGAGKDAQFSGLDLSVESPDTVTLSDDRRILTLSISVGTGIDQVRVLTQSAPPAPPPATP